MHNWPFLFFEINLSFYNYLLRLLSFGIWFIKELRSLGCWSDSENDDDNVEGCRERRNRLKTTGRLCFIWSFPIFVKVACYDILK